MQGSGCRVQGAGCRVHGAGCRVQGAGRRVQGAGCRVQGAGCRAWDDVKDEENEGSRELVVCAGPDDLGVHFVEQPPYLDCGLGVGT